MEETVQALNLLYSSSDPALKKQADDWLVQWQQTAPAWQISDQILSQENAPIPYTFFAAQTMRTKIQFDFNELPAESYSSLRDSLIRHIFKFRDPQHQPIHTQLAIAVADLAIQMDSAWQNPVGSLFETFGTSADNYAALLEILKMLPEENMNYKLMTDTHKRANSRQVLQGSTSNVVQFLLQLIPQCPNDEAKRKVLECFLSWVKFTNFNPHELAQNQLFLGTFQAVTEGSYLSEVATDIIVEVLRMSSQDLQYYEPVIRVCIQQTAGLRDKFEKLVSRGEDGIVEDKESAQQICRIYTEIGECLVPWIMDQNNNPEVLSILKILCMCTNLPLQEISVIPLEFWHRIRCEVCRRPEQDAKVDQFQGIFVEVLKVVLIRCTLPTDADPFQMDDDYTAYRARLLQTAEDCLEVLTPNTALEHVLQSLQQGQGQGVTTQESHFFVLTAVGARAQVREGSVLWMLIQSLPPLISQEIQQDNLEAALLHYTKKTAIELLGCLWKWVKTKPDFLRSSLNMISTILLSPAPPPGAAPHILERVKQTQQSASIALKDICSGGKAHLQDLVPQLCQLYTGTMALPIRMHLCIVEGVGAVAAHLQNDADFKQGIEQLLTPLVQGMQSEQDKPNILAEILDRLTTIIRQFRVQEGSAKAITIGECIEKMLWPLVRQTLMNHATDSKVVEKGCRVLKHSMRCVPELFKPNVSGLAQLLVLAFQQNQHSSFLYSAEILANTYASDPEIIPILTHLFQSLSGTAFQVLSNNVSKLEEITELVEDFYGMFERYLRYAPMVVLGAPTLPNALQLCVPAIFVQQKDAMEAIIAFIEAVFNLVAEANRNRQCEKTRFGQILRPHVLAIAPDLLKAIFQLIAQVPTRSQQETIPCVIECVRDAFGKELFAQWTEAGLVMLPPAVGSNHERMKFRSHLVDGDSHQIYDTVADMCYRSEQIVLRNRNKPKEPTGPQAIRDK